VPLDGTASLGTVERVGCRLLFLATAAVLAASCSSSGPTSTVQAVAAEDAVFTIGPDGRQLSAVGTAGRGDGGRAVAAPGGAQLLAVVGPGVAVVSSDAGATVVTLFGADLGEMASTRVEGFTPEFAATVGDVLTVVGARGDVPAAVSLRVPDLAELAAADLRSLTDASLSVTAVVGAVDSVVVFGDAGDFRVMAALDPARLRIVREAPLPSNLSAPVAADVGLEADVVVALAGDTERWFVVTLSLATFGVVGRVELPDVGVHPTTLLRAPSGAVWVVAEDVDGSTVVVPVDPRSLPSGAPTRFAGLLPGGVVLNGESLFGVEEASPPSLRRLGP
jgi:hypothetical protein